MKDSLPERLTRESYMPRSGVFEILRHSVRRPWALHCHDFYEIELVLSGGGRHRVNGVESVLREGSCFLLTPADFHEIDASPGDPLDIVNIKFSDSALRDDVKDLLFSSGRALVTLFSGSELGGLKSDFFCLLDEYAHSRLGRQTMLDSGLFRIIVRLLRQSETHAPKNTAACALQPAVQKACAYINCHFRENITLADAAKQANLSANYFSECFHKIMRVPFRTYLNNLRLSFAHSLLVCSAMPVTEVCFASGFGSLSHFLKAFKKAYGKSPGSLRKETNQS